MSLHLPNTLNFISTISGRHPQHELSKTPMVYVKDRELLIPVKAAGINRIDLVQSLGSYLSTS